MSTAHASICKTSRGSPLPPEKADNLGICRDKEKVQATLLVIIHKLAPQQEDVGERSVSRLVSRGEGEREIVSIRCRNVVRTIDR